MDRISNWTSAMVVAILAVIMASPAAAQDEATANAGRAAYPDGAYAFAVGDHAAAREIFGEECRSGQSQSCLRAADDWRVGRGGPQDYDEAIDYADLACTAGLVDGCSLAASIHFAGRKTGEPDYDSARAFYARGCELDDPRSCAGLGNMQYMGFGGPRERRDGIANLRRACDQEFDYACEQLRSYGQNR